MSASLLIERVLKGVPPTVLVRNIIERTNWSEGHWHYTDKDDGMSGDSSASWDSETDDVHFVMVFDGHDKSVSLQMMDVTKDYDFIGNIDASVSNWTPENVAAAASKIATKKGLSPISVGAMKKLFSLRNWK